MLKYDISNYCINILQDPWHFLALCSVIPRRWIIDLSRYINIYPWRGMARCYPWRDVIHGEMLSMARCYHGAMLSVARCYLWRDVIHGAMLSVARCYLWRDVILSIVIYGAMLLWRDVIHGACYLWRDVIIC